MLKLILVYKPNFGLLEDKEMHRILGQIKRNLIPVLFCSCMTQFSQQGLASVREDQYEEIYCSQIMLNTNRQAVSFALILLTIYDY